MFENCDLQPSCHMCVQFVVKLVFSGCVFSGDIASVRQTQGSPIIQGSCLASPCTPPPSTPPSTPPPSPPPSPRLAGTPPDPLCSRPSTMLINPTRWDCLCACLQRNPRTANCFSMSFCWRPSGPDVSWLHTFCVFFIPLVQGSVKTGWWTVMYNP